MADDNPVEGLTPGQILTDASVAQFITAMGLSVAEAQKQLDVNTIGQIEEYLLPRPGLQGKSLLEVGLSPPFYHYQHADLAVSLQLSIKVGSTKATDINAKLDLSQTTKDKAGGAREAQIKIAKLPASVTADGTKHDAPTGGDVEAAANAIADKLRVPEGKFERAFVTVKRTTPKAELNPAATKNPIVTPGAVAFLSPKESSSGVIRIAAAPIAAETFTLAQGKAATVQPVADKLQYARNVVTALNALGGFKARLAQDPGTTAALLPGGTIAIALFDTDKSVIKKEALSELGIAAALLKEGKQKVDVIGYGDTRASDEYNKGLGQRRADAVADQLKKLGVPEGQINKPTSGGEERWKDTPQNTDNLQFRRVEVIIPDAPDLLIIVEGDATQLQDKPEPDKRAAAGNGFIVVQKSAAQPVSGKLKLNDTTELDFKGEAADGEAPQSPEAFAANLVTAINAGTATHKVRASRRGAVVVLSGADDEATIALFKLSEGDVKLSADGGATITKPLATVSASGEGGKERNTTVAFGVAVGHRTSRQFEQTVTGNSSISARLVAVPAPAEFLDEIRSFLGNQGRGVLATNPTTAQLPAATPTPTPTPAPTPAPAPVTPP